MILNLTKHGFKDTETATQLLEMRPTMLLLLYELIIWADSKKLPVVLTSTVREKLAESISETHNEGRAFDVSVSGWAEENINECVNFFNNKHAKEWGTASAGKEPHVVLYHKTPTGAFHFHFQIKRGI